MHKTLTSFLSASWFWKCSRHANFFTPNYFHNCCNLCPCSLTSIRTIGTKWCSLIALCISHVIAAGFTSRPTLRPNHLVQLRPQIHFAEFGCDRVINFQADIAAYAASSTWHEWDGIVWHGSTINLQEIPTNMDAGSGWGFASILIIL